jgi:predicted RNase H-like HicB family nuclease
MHEEVKREMHEATEFHLDGLRLAGEPVPQPRSEAAYCEVAA